MERNTFEILEGAIDIHLHPGPSITARRVDFFEAARDAASVGMRAVVYKPLYFATLDAAYAAQVVVPEIKVFGGVTLDAVAGGLRPATVEVAIRMGAKVIWMPLFDSAHTRMQAERVPFYKKRLFGNDSISILDEAGKVKPEVMEIIDLIAAAKSVVLDACHLSPRETVILTREARKRGVENVVATHPSANIIGATIQEQKEMAEAGAYLNHCFGYQLPKPDAPGQDPRGVAEAIKAVGPKHCIMSSDMGIWYSPPPVEGLRSFCEIMMQLGIERSEIDVMVKENPARVLGM
jgi:hypothetical protein